VVGKAEMIFVLLRMRNPELVAVVESRSLHYTGFPFRDPGSGRDDEVWVVVSRAWLCSGCGTQVRHGAD
jgi:hypothetical protein